MKKLVLTICMAAFALTISAQKLVDLYKKGAVKLIPDTEFGNGNNWDQVFKTYYDTIYNTPMGNRKSLILMPDGSSVVNNRYRNYYIKFSPNGKFEKEFGIKNSNGIEMKEVNQIEGIVNNNTFYTGLDNMGNMVCFDFNGNYVKTLKLDYMTHQMISLPNNKIAVVGWVIWAKKFRDFVAIVDYQTNQEKIIWEYFTDRSDQNGERKLFNYSYRFKTGGMISYASMPYSGGLSISSPPQISCVGNKLIVALPKTGEIEVYDLDGNLISKEKIGWPMNYISVAEQKVIQQEAIDKLKGTDVFGSSGKISPEEIKLANETIISEMEADLNKITTPIPLPTFSTILKDSDGNLLFFEYPKEENANKFNVWIYGNSGSFVCQSSFVCDDYKLEINPSKMVFYNGYIYGLQLLKNSSGVPLRLVRFKISNN